MYAAALCALAAVHAESNATASNATASNATSSNATASSDRRATAAPPGSGSTNYLVTNIYFLTHVRQHPQTKLSLGWELVLSSAVVALVGFAIVVCVYVLQTPDYEPLI